VTRDFTQKIRSDKGGVTRDVRIDRNGTVTVYELRSGIDCQSVAEADLRCVHHMLGE
jgi:hypothetical protein